MHHMQPRDREEERTVLIRADRERLFRVLVDLQPDEDHRQHPCDCPTEEQASPVAPLDAPSPPMIGALLDSSSTVPRIGPTRSGGLMPSGGQTGALEAR